ncbi:MAG: UDP-N-acetylmuramoyl-tripeptide--D-alanyl-D-alanine ligase [Bdellovibrionales bacterium]|jgi:UDP-N-acetylmuramoyl-tripeptide--D-alanyl-D-alanine ligase|nr:UDP-N-acetylmuramoyl-tripeptide--D-alanyl-D-alanine ligase [Bdellovibrionales bacterium]
MTGWNLSAQEAAAAVDGKLQLIGGGGLTDAAFHGVATDTRLKMEGMLFVALVGESHDAHAYVRKAVEQGASGLMIHRELTLEEKSEIEALVGQRGFPVAVISAGNTLTALQVLARHWRHKCRAMILGITGTNGKTSTKEFAATILSTRFNVQYSKGSFNNHWGVPFSLLSISQDHDVAVIEMGMNHPGELKDLSKIVEADAVVCTMVGRGHLEGVGSIEGAAAAKSEIYEYAPSKATFIFNLDNPYTSQMMAKFTDEGRRTITFAESAGDISLRVKAMTMEALTVEGSIKGIEGSVEIPVFGRHNVTNLMAAACLALVAGMSPQEIWKALPLCRSAWGRNQWIELASRARCLFDGYNANPESMGAALENARLLVESGSIRGRAIAVLGEMRELGSHAENLHEELGSKAASVGFDEVVFIGASHAAFARGFGATKTKLSVLPKFDASEKAEQALVENLRKGLSGDDFILIKGSRGVKLETLLAGLSPVGSDLKK